MLPGSTGTAKQGEPAKQGEKLPHWSDPHSRVHTGCGCDSCGVNFLLPFPANTLMSRLR